MSDVLNLITEVFTQDKYGNDIAAETKKETFCEVMSISKSEFYQAGEAGHKPAFRFDIFVGDYNNENIVEHNSKRYYIYRVYINNDTAELYAEEKVGV